MNSACIEGHLRGACSVLDFDIGELWEARIRPGTAEFIKVAALHFFYQ